VPTASGRRKNDPKPKGENMKSSTKTVTGSERVQLVCGLKWMWESKEDEQVGPIYWRGNEIHVEFRRRIERHWRCMFKDEAMELLSSEGHPVHADQIDFFEDDKSGTKMVIRLN
jgi:hypothetical protein